jgi:hypothetical protein
MLHLAQIDQDGWTGRSSDLRLPATDKFKTAYLVLQRFPGPTDLPVTATINGAAAPFSLELEKPYRLAVPLSATTETKVHLATERTYPLSAADPRERSFRIVDIDLE